MSLQYNNKTMFAITYSTSFAAGADRFKKFGKKMKKQRQDDFSKIRDKFSDIAKEEQRRAKDILKEHKDFFKETKKSKDSSAKKTSIDFYEK
jgi:hypothetical protein